MKKISIILILIFVSCSSSKGINYKISIDKKIEKIEKDLSSFNKEIINLKNLYPFDFGNYATAYRHKSKLYKIEYNFPSWSYTLVNNDNLDTIQNLRYREDLISIIGEIYIYNNKPILIREKIKRDLGYWSGMGRDGETGEYKMATITTNNDNDFKIYVQNWDKSEIIIENLFGSFTKWDFKKDFYNDIIEEVKKQ